RGRHTCFSRDGSSDVCSSELAAGARANPNVGLEQMARDFLQPAVEQALAEQAGMPLRAEVVMGNLDSRLRLAPCNGIEPFLPPKIGSATCRTRGAMQEIAVAV